MNRATIVATIVLVLVLGTGGPATAQGLSFADPAGDTALGRGLDITQVTFRNRDHAITASVEFRRVKRAHLIVAFQTRSGSVAALVSKYRPVHGDKNRVETRGGDRCRGFAVTWDASAETAVMRMPARCFRGGNYGAVRFFVVTEDRQGAFDVAPDAEGRRWFSWSQWVPRG